MSVGGMQSAAAKAFGGPRKMEWKTPKDGKEIVGCLVGGYAQTRVEIIKELWSRYGIRVIKHFGDEMKKSIGGIFIDPRVEVVVMLADDLSDAVLQKVLSCCRAGGQDHLAINRRQKHAWDHVFAASGYHNPPKWRDGYLIENPADPDKLEAERLAELAALEKPRQAYVDPKLQLVGGAKLGDKLLPRMAEAEAVLNQYKPQPKPAPTPPPQKTSPRATAARIQRGDGAGFAQKVSPPGWPSQLRALREATGLQQNVFCKKYGFGQSNISSWELGKTVPAYSLLLKLQALFPTLGEPPGVRGKQIYEKRAKQAAAQAEAKQAAKDAKAEAKLSREALNTAIEKAPAVVAAKPSKGATVASPPAAVVVPPPAPQDPAQFAEKVIRSMGQEELLTVNLRSGGSITLMASVQLMKLKGEDRKFVFEIIDALQAYEEKKE